MKNILYWFLLLTFFLPVTSPANDLHFTQISPKSGTSQNTVWAVVEDDLGFIWAGTLDGLNRYDGYKINTYRPDKENPYSLTDHRTRAMFKDSNGLLWIKNYENEFNCYNPVNNQFISFCNEEGKPIKYSDYFEAQNGDIWLWGTENGVLKIQKELNGIFSQQHYLSSASGEIKPCNFLLEDTQGNIWAGGESGLVRIQPDGSMESYFHEEGSIRSFNRGTELLGKIYFTTSGSRLIIYDIKQRYFENIPYSPGNIEFVHIALLDNNTLLLTSSEKVVFSFNIHTNKFSILPLQFDVSDKKSHFITDKNKGIWIYNNTGNLIYYNYQKQEQKSIRLIPEEISKIAELGGIFIDSKNRAWIYTYGYGLFLYKPENGQLTHYQNKPGTNSLASDFLLSITEDRFGNIWIGSEYAGLIRVVQSHEYIHTVRPEKNEAVGKNNNVRTLLEDFHNNIWVGTKNGSLYVYDSQLHHHKCIGENLNPYTLVEDKKQRMWIGTKGNGLYIYDSKTFKQIAHYTHNPNDTNSICFNVIFHLLIDTRNRLWIASFGGGLDMIEEVDGKVIFHHFLQNSGNKSFIRCLYQDSKGMIWAGSSDGIIRFDPDQLIEDPARYTSYTINTNTPNSLNNNDIKTIYEDFDHTIWIGTAGGGINKFIEATDTQPEQFINYTTLNGLADNFISGILEHDNNLWISSENGITRLNKDDFSFMTYHFSENQFGNNFNEGAYIKCRDGKMLWGSLDGILVFHPETFIPENSTPIVTFTGFQVEGLESGKNGAAPFDRSISFTDKIQLKHYQNTFTIEFATLILRNPDKNKYMYMLENYDKRWSRETHLNSATYKNLPPGKYIFKTKGANHNNIWNPEITKLEITIQPPFWKSAYAYILYAVLVVLLLYIISKIIIKMNTLHNAVELEKQLTNHKLRFFTNISHEFRTPLTLINGAVESLIETEGLPPKIEKHIHILNRNSNNLSRLIDELLEFRKLQNNTLTLNLERTDIITFAGNIFNEFRELANQKRIHMHFVTEDQELYLFIDRKKVDKILNNLLSNAIKFTGKDGYIELNLALNSKNETCMISVKDNGIGIPPEKQHLLFSRFMQIHFSAAGTGVGLSLVKEFVEVHKGRIYYEDNPGGGAVFTVELSTSQEVYKDDNFINTYPEIITGEINPSTNNEPAPEEIIPEIEDATLSNYKLLIIDDNDDIRNFLSAEFCNYLMVDTAENGDKGLQKAIETNPDIIICDVMMPEKDGFEVTRLLKKEFQTCHIPIILLTAHSSIEHRLEGIESGADSYITKPFSLKYVTRRVFKLIEQRELLKKRFSNEFVTDAGYLTTTARDQKFYEMINRILEENMADSTFSVDRFAELAGIKRTIFYKKVKGITGFSPNEFVKIKRLKKAAALLLEEKLNVSEISYAVGFEDPFYFSKCFKAHFKCSPSKYIQTMEKAKSISID